MKTDPQQFERELQAKFPELAATENDPIIVESGKFFSADQAKIKILAGMLDTWLRFLEIDFECDEDAPTYPRMQTYIEGMDYISRHFPEHMDPYRERMYRRVKERMSEIKI